MAAAASSGSEALNYDTLGEAVAIANDTPFGLAEYVTGADLGAARVVAARIRSGDVLINDAEFDWSAPWGGCS